MKWMALTLVAISMIAVSGADARDDSRQPTMPDESIYQLGGVFRDQDNRSARLGDSAGHPVMISMFYASCPDTCPLLIAELQRIEAALPRAVRADLRVVLVSFDPERDTPAVLKNLAQRYRLDGVRWRLLTGEDDAVREVAAVLGVKFRKLSKGVFNHSSIIAVLDKRGLVIERVDGISPGDPTNVQRVRAALQRTTPQGAVR